MTAGSEPPSRSGVTYLVAMTRGSTRTQPTREPGTLSAFAALLLARNYTSGIRQNGGNPTTGSAKALLLNQRHRPLTANGLRGQEQKSSKLTCSLVIT